MPYQTLEKLFYRDASSDRFARASSLLAQRLHAESTFRTRIELRGEELFLAVPRELSLLNETILRRERRVSALWRGLPPVARGAAILSLIMDEVVYSNDIEGIHSTRRQVELALEEVRRDTSALAGAAEKQHPPFAEFAKLYLELGDEPRQPRTLQDIRDIYDSVVRDAIDRKDRLDTNLFRPREAVIEDNRGRVVHEGVPSEQIGPMLEQWLELSQDDTIPEAYRAVLCHFLFGYIHPFNDGNGRTGRYLLSLQLSRPLSEPTVLSLSRTIAENKGAYYKAFDTVERPLNHMEATPFVLAMLELVAEAQEGLVVDLEDKRSALERLSGYLGSCELPLGKREKDVLFYVAQMELFHVFGGTELSRLARYLGVSAPTARKATTRLAEEGLLAKTRMRPPTFRLTEKGLRLLGISDSARDTRNTR